MVNYQHFKTIEGSKGSMDDLHTQHSTMPHQVLKSYISWVCEFGLHASLNIVIVSVAI